MNVYDKYMAPLSSNMEVRTELERLGISEVSEELGDVVIYENITGAQRQQLKIALLNKGFKQIDEDKALLVENINNTIIENVYHLDGEPIILNFPAYLSEKLNCTYNHLDVVFKKVTGINIEKFILIKRIERAKVLIINNELNISEIALMLNFSSSAHFRYQFKRITGYTTTFFKQINVNKCDLIEDLSTDW